MFVQLENIQLKDSCPWMKPNPPGWVHTENTVKTLNNNNWCFRITFCYFPESSKIKLKNIFLNLLAFEHWSVCGLKRLLQFKVRVGGYGEVGHNYTFGRKKFNKWQHGMCSGPHMPKKRWSAVKCDGSLRSTVNSVCAATEAEHAKSVCE